MGDSSHIRRSVAMIAASLLRTQETRMPEIRMLETLPIPDSRAIMGMAKAIRMRETQAQEIILLRGRLGRILT
jgi:hypothetical protein